MTRWHRPGRPPWWPHNEAWPPARARWAPRRARFLRLAAAAIVVCLVFAGVGVATVTWAIVSYAGERAGPQAPVAGVVLAVVAIAIVLAAALAAGSIGRHVGPPVRDLVQGADAVARGDYMVRVREAGPGPLRAVARAFNAMAARLAERSAEQRNLFADTAHELRTPLAVVQARIEGLLDGVYPRSDEQLQRVADDIRVLTRLVDDLRTLAEADSGALELRPEPTDVALLATDAVESLRPSAVQAGVDLTCNAADDVPLVYVDPVRIREVIVNLAANAIRHTPAGGSVTVRVGRRRVERCVVISVRDTGPGIAPADRARIFDRFFKGAGSTGSGLGLTIARRLAEAHGGAVILEDSTPGSEFTVTLPE